MAAVIKLNPEGKVILRNGKPSCTCCVTTLYVERTIFIHGDYPATVVDYFTLTGSVNSGFTGISVPNEFGDGTELYYNAEDGEWILAGYFGMSMAGAPDDPTGFYVGSSISNNTTHTATVSLTPLP